MLRAILNSSMRFWAKPNDKMLEAAKALEGVKGLRNDGKLKEALLKLDEIEAKYPQYIKTTSFYRGKIGVEFLDKLAETDKSVASHFSKK